MKLKGWCIFCIGSHYGWCCIQILYFIVCLHYMLHLIVLHPPQPRSLHHLLQGRHVSRRPRAHSNEVNLLAVYGAGLLPRPPAQPSHEGYIYIIYNIHLIQYGAGPFSVHLQPSHEGRPSSCRLRSWPVFLSSIALAQLCISSVRTPHHWQFS